MNIEKQIVVFLIENNRYALNISAVERIIPSVEITKLPEAPKIIDGVIKVGENIIPVANVRRRFHLPEREISLSDKIIIAKTKKRIIGLIAEFVQGVSELDGRKPAPAKDIIPSLKYIAGIVQLDDGLVLIHDLEEFLSNEEEEELNKALNKMKDNQ